jgi:hypothetical protein
VDLRTRTSSFWLVGCSGAAPCALACALASESGAYWFDPADHDVHAQHPVIVAEEFRHFMTATGASRS